MLIKRRDFLKLGSLASASLFIPDFLKALEKPNPLLSKNKILVILQWSGGNDGLNTIIPVRNDIYYRERNQLSIKRENALSLTDEASINPNLRYFKELYENGELAVLNNVGYPNPDKSHFRSMDIWQSGSSSEEYWDTGWLGRYLDEACYNCSQPTQALEVDDMLSLALKGHENKAFAFKEPKRLFQTSNEKFFKTLYDEHEHDHDHETAEYLYKTMGSTISNAKYIYDKSISKQRDAEYPKTQLGYDFKTISSLIISDINTQVYYVSIGSFDTHTNQMERQTKLFQEINDAIKSFTLDMKKNGRFEDVLVVTFSEFGRRVAQNASGGTDHGTANQMFFIGGGLKRKGILNSLPNLNTLNDGDLIYSEDFRKVYSTILKKWLLVDDQNIMGKKFGYYDFI